MDVGLVESGAALQSMRNSDFDVYSAYGEVIDNSVQADAHRIRIKIVYDPRTSQRRGEPIERIAFGDDGIGMVDEVLHRCLQLGYSSRFNDRSGIGRFGVGATLAAINQCKKVELYSKVRDGHWIYTYIDLDMVMSNPTQMAAIPAPRPKAIPAEFNDLAGEHSGTLVVWSKYDRQPTDASEIISEMKVWIGRTYRKFLWNNLEISVNGETVHAIDPLYVSTEKTRFPDDPPAHEFTKMVLPWPIPPEDQAPGGRTTDNILIRMSLLHEQFRPNQGSGNSREAKERHIDRNNGVSILRNGREVYYDTIPHWPGERMAEIDRWWGCEISFDAILDKEFTVKNIKRGALPVKKLKDALCKLIEPTRNTALERVREIWAREKAAKKTTALGAGVSTGHEDAERAAENTPTPKSVLDRDKDLDEESNKVMEEWLAHEDERQKAAWKAKFQSQPFTILDAEWRGPEFVETNHLGGRDVLRYNMRHVFFSELEAIRSNFDSNGSEDGNARKLRALIDLLLISYAKAESMIDPTLQWTPERLLEELRMNWGNYLKNYIDTFNKENPTGND
jgi:hypothetical protein